MQSKSLIFQNWHDVQQQVQALQKPKGDKDITIVVVSKTRSLKEIQQAIEVGIKHFGENRIEEVEEKWAELPSSQRQKITLHMVGQVQSRKAARVARLCDWVHSVDRLKLAQKLGQAARDLNKSINILVQINTSGEKQKSGYELTDWFESGHDQQLLALEKDLLLMSQISGVKLQGLMTMAPFSGKQKVVRQSFKRLAELRDLLLKKHPHLNLKHLSMGMTNDYPLAVEEGATMLRIGRAVFGERK